MHSLPSLESLHDHHASDPQQPPHLSHNNNNNPSPMSSKPAFMEIQQLEQQGHLGGSSSAASDVVSMYPHHPPPSIRSPYTSGAIPGSGGIPLPEYATRSPLAGYPFTGIPALSSGYAPPPPAPPSFGMSHYQSPPLGLGREGKYIFSDNLGTPQFTLFKKICTSAYFSIK